MGLYRLRSYKDDVVLERIDGFFNYDPPIHMRIIICSSARARGLAFTLVEYAKLEN